MKILQLIKKWAWCRWAHDKHRCFPEVGGRGIDGPWHCAKCHPCSDDFKGIFTENTAETATTACDFKITEIDGVPVSFLEGMADVEAGRVMDTDFLEQDEI